MMPEIKWSERFSVGVREMDEQHERLIEMINSMQGKSDAGTVFDIVMRMFNYADVHFQTEEKLLRSRGYSELDQQIRQHKEFLAKTTDFSGRNFAEPAACAQVASYLRDWLVRHILEEDMKYKHLLSQHGG